MPAPLSRGNTYSPSSSTPVAAANLLSQLARQGAPDSRQVTTALPALRELCPETRVVAHGSYGDRVAPLLEARAAAVYTRQVPPADVAAAKPALLWHIAADWTEAFGPVVFEPIEARLREQALDERARLDALRAAGQPLVRPQVLLLDDVPVYGRDRSGTGKSRRDDGFFLLVVAEVHWRDSPRTDPFALDTQPERDMKLRLVRAMPKSNTAAWRLVLDELGYDPDFVVADAGTGIARAIEEQYDPARTTFIPSLWQSVRRSATAWPTRGERWCRCRVAARSHCQPSGRTWPSSAATGPSSTCRPGRLGGTSSSASA